MRLTDAQIADAQDIAETLTRSPDKLVRLLSGRMTASPKPAPGHAAPANGTTVDGLEPEDPPAEPLIIRMSDVQPERVEWVWPGRLPIGKLVVLDGDPGCGKSTLTLDVAARISTGSPMPDGYTPDAPGSVVLMSAEDGPGDTIRPRLDAAGADPNRVVLFDAVREPDPNRPEVMRDRPPSIPADLHHLERIVTAEKAVLVVVDVLAAFLTGKVDSHRDQDVRGALAPLAKIAERTRCCIVIIRHLNKSGGSKALYRGGGSIGIVGAARVGLVAGSDPEDDTRRILAVAKSNLAAVPPSLAYRLATHPLFKVGMIHWEGATKHTADDLVADRHDDPDDDRDDAARALVMILADGPKWSKDAIDEMVLAGYTKDQARRARKRAGVVTEKYGKPGDAVQGWKWRLAANPEDGTEDGEDGSSQNPASFAIFVPPSQPVDAQTDR
ncbi:MAG: AAA family ATPase [Actinobacteria bacterium]|nr:AAA family ATPase [Actinomycetota bacterium]